MKKNFWLLIFVIGMMANIRPAAAQQNEDEKRAKQISHVKDFFLHNTQGLKRLHEDEANFVITGSVSMERDGQSLTAEVWAQTTWTSTIIELRYFDEEDGVIRVEWEKDYLFATMLKDKGKEVTIPLKLVGLDDRHLNFLDEEAVMPLFIKIWR